MRAESVGQRVEVPWFATSSSITSGVVDSRLAMAWVIFIVRPKEVSTTSAPCSWAILATWNAMELSIRTPVTRSFLPSRIPMSSRDFLVWEAACVRK